MNIGTYVEWLKLILTESGKYFLLLLVAGLAVRLWRRFPGVAAGRGWRCALAGSVVSVLACSIGYVSVRHSLGLLYTGYGMKAFREGRLPSALNVLDQAANYWPSADNVGRTGICLLYLEDPDRAMPLLGAARAKRKGQTSHFEAFHTGIYYFFHDQPAQAEPLLMAVSSDMEYCWDAAKLLAAIELERQHPEPAAKLMAPYRGVEVTECDQAYVIAGLELSEGRLTRAQRVLERFPPARLPDFWKARFETMRAKAQLKTL